MIIDRQLNLVVPIQRDDQVLYVHATPIGYDVFKKYHLVLSKTFSAVFAHGLSVTSGPREAALLLRDVAEATVRTAGVSWWEGEDGVERGLIGEMVRLANVLCPRPEGGFTPEMLDTAIKREQISEEEADDAIGQVTFFTLAWRVAPRTARLRFIEGACSLYGASTTSLNSTEYAKSLTTSSEAASSGESPQP